MVKEIIIVFVLIIAIIVYMLGSNLGAVPESDMISESITNMRLNTVPMEVQAFIKKTPRSGKRNVTFNEERLERVFNKTTGSIIEDRVGKM